MMVYYFVSQHRHVDVRIYLRRTYALVAQHGLYGPERRAAFEQCRGKGVAQRVGRDGLLDACSCGILLYHNMNHDAREVRTASVEEYIVLLAGLYLHPVAVLVPQMQLMQGALRDGYEALFVALAGDTDVAFLLVYLRQAQAYQL